jgi:hypothetical protein
LIAARTELPTPLHARVNHELSSPFNDKRNPSRGNWKLEKRNAKFENRKPKHATFRALAK